MGQKYAFAVMDGNEAPDQYRLAASCHHSLTAAVRERDRRNRKNPNARFYVAAWGAERWARLRPAPEHGADIVRLGR